MDDVVRGYDYALERYYDFLDVHVWMIFVGYFPVRNIVVLWGWAFLPSHLCAWEQMAFPYLSGI